MKKIDFNLDLVLVPARLLERVVNSEHSLHVLNHYESLLGILTTEDLYFYNGVNANIAQYLPQQVVSAFNTYTKRINPSVFESIDKTATDVYMTTLTSSGNNITQLLSICENTKRLQSVDSTSNNYVGQYFAIDDTTIGAVLVPTNTVRQTQVESAKNLLSLLYDDYLIKLDNQSVFRNANFRIRALADCNLLAYYCDVLFNHRL